MDWTGSGVVLRTKSSSVETITISRSPEVDLFLGYERDCPPIGVGLTLDLPPIGTMCANPLPIDAVQVLMKVRHI